MGIANLVLDFYDDTTGEGMDKIAMPDAVQNLEIAALSPEDRAGLADSEYGLVMITKRASVVRKFPVNDPGNAWLSAQYFAQNHEKIAFPARFVAAKWIKEACDAYGVPPHKLVDAYAARAGDVTDNTFVEGSEPKWLLQKLAEREAFVKEASGAETNAISEMPNEHFAMVVKMGDGTVIRKYAMPDAAYVEKAAAYFDKYAMELQPNQRHNFAESVKRRAEELEVDVSKHPAIEKWASAEWNPHFPAHIEARKSLLPRNEKARDILTKLAASLGDTNPADMAEALATFDDATGLTRYHDRGLSDPYASTMGKVASGWSEEVDEREITEADLRKLAASTKVASYYGNSFADSFRKDPISIFESLPAPDKVMLKQMVDGGV